MHSLASIFVSIVFVANSLFPKSNIPQVLGVKIAQTGDTNQTTVIEPVSRKFGVLERIKIGDNASASAKNRIEEEKNRREEFKTRVTQIRDEKKKERLTQLDSNLAKINQKAVEHWNKVLNRLTEILAKIKTRMTEVSENGKDVTIILAAVSIAEVKIAEAKVVVNTQSDKIYTISVGEEDKLGESAKTTISQMRNDIKSVGDTVKEAIQSLKDVHTALKSVIGSE